MVIPFEFMLLRSCVWLFVDRIKNCRPLYKGWDRVLQLYATLLVMGPMEMGWVDVSYILLDLLPKTDVMSAGWVCISALTRHFHLYGTGLQYLLIIESAPLWYRRKAYVSTVLESFQPDPVWGPLVPRLHST